eukprot:1214411-Pyramimonas_sp.AAC.1
MKLTLGQGGAGRSHAPASQNLLLPALHAHAKLCSWPGNPGAYVLLPPSTRTVRNQAVSWPPLLARTTHFRTSFAVRGGSPRWPQGAPGLAAVSRTSR